MSSSNPSASCIPLLLPPAVPKLDSCSAAARPNVCFCGEQNGNCHGPQPGRCRRRQTLPCRPAPCQAANSADAQHTRPPPWMTPVAPAVRHAARPPTPPMLHQSSTAAVKCARLFPRRFRIHHYRSMP